MAKVAAIIILQIKYSTALLIVKSPYPLGITATLTSCGENTVQYNEQCFMWNKSVIPVGYANRSFKGYKNDTDRLLYYASGVKFIYGRYVL